ncbi:tRNA guanosine(34) transglycosylase Tgt [Patescibacteria group bacterium]
MSFSLQKSSAKSSARLGELELAHGQIATPFFMPIATQGAIKGLTTMEMKDLGAQILLANTYHLWLRPGEDVVAKAGGLQEFMKWDGPILTDSGGYQVFSLAKIRQIEDGGIEFQSHIDGSKRFLTPEKAIEIQQALSSDIMMVLDECVKFPCSRQEAEKAVERTSRWAKISSNLKAQIKRESKISNEKSQKLFGIVQGSTFKDLRLRSVKELVKLDFDGYAIGGLAVGEPAEEMYKVLDYLVPELPEDKPRYLMGVGYPEQIVESVKRGIDMFDCVLPTRNARHGSLFVSCESDANDTKEYLPGKFYCTIHIKNKANKEDFSVLDKNCACPTCQAGYSKAYLRHLLVAEEPLYVRLATAHNLNFYLRMMSKIREAIAKNRIC